MSGMCGMSGMSGMSGVSGMSDIFSLHSNNWSSSVTCWTQQMCALVLASLVMAADVLLSFVTKRACAHVKGYA
jgi:hypothetical protein